MAEFQTWLDSNLSSPWVRLALGALIGMFCGLIAATVLKVIARRARGRLLSAVANNLRSVAFVIGTLLGINFGLQAFAFTPETMEKVDNSFTFGIFILVTWALTHVYSSIHDLIIVPWGRRTDNSTLVDVGHTVVNILIWLLGLISGLSSAGFNVSAVLAGLGIGGLAIALAAQDAVSNIFGGVIILTQAPFRVGDRIEISGTDGWVTNIGIRATTIRNWYGHRITMPNKMFTNNSVANIDARGEYWEEIQLKLRYDTTLEQAERAMERIRAILTDHEHLRSTFWVGLSKIGEGYIQIEVWYGTISYLAEGGKGNFPNEYSKVLDVKSGINLEVLKALEEEDIHLAMPVVAHIQQQGPAQGRF